MKHQVKAVPTRDSYFPSLFQEFPVTNYFSLPQEFRLGTLRPNEITALEKWIRGRAAIRNGFKVAAGFLKEMTEKL